LDIQPLVRGPTLTLAAAAEYETEMEALVFSAWVSIDATDGKGGRLGGGLSEVDVGGRPRGVVSSKWTERRHSFSMSQVKLDHLKHFLSRNISTILYI
jgi:hypothetical protein